MYVYFFSYANLLSVINSAANFLVYMLRGRKFRKAFISTYNCHKCTSEAIEVWINSEFKSTDLILLWSIEQYLGVLFGEQTLMQYFQHYLWHSNQFFWNNKWWDFSPLLIKIRHQNYQIIHLKIYQIHYKNAHFILIFDIYSRKNFAFQSNVEWVHGSDQDEHLVIFKSGHLSHDFKDFGHDFLDLFFGVKDPQSS